MRINGMRKPRVFIEGAWYHVTARVNHGEMLLDNSTVRDLFLALVARAKKGYRFQVVDFCIMGNHIHLLVQPGPKESLSDIMRWLLGVFARVYNKKRVLTGHYWGESFHSRILDGLKQIAIAFCYIDENPVKAGLVARACEWCHGGAWRDLIGDRLIIDERPPWRAFLGALRALPPCLVAEL